VAVVGNANSNAATRGGRSGSGAKKGSLDVDVQTPLATAGNAELLAQAPVTRGAHM